MHQLEPAIERFIQAHNRHDMSGINHFFDPEAVVLTQDQIWVGYAGISRWHRQQAIDANLEITAVRRHYGEFYLQTRPQSTATSSESYQYVFALQDGRISRLIIQSMSSTT